MAKEAIDVRNKIKEYTNKIEDIRRMEALKKINRAVGEEDIMASQEEKEFQKIILECRKEYNEKMDQLRSTKSEIER